MILGAFANFAQNEWGNKLITICEFIIAITFFSEAISCLVPAMIRKDRGLVNLVEITLGILPAIALTTFFHSKGDAVIDTAGNFISWFLLSFLCSVVITERIFALVKIRDRAYVSGFVENYFLSAVFLGMVMNNLFLSGSATVSFSAFVGLVCIYVISTVKFFRRNFKSGKRIVPLLTLGSVAALLMGVGLVAKRFHWPAAIEVVYTGLALGIILILLLVKRNFTYNDQPITVAASLKLFHTHIVLVFFLVFFFNCYLALQTTNMAPRFYSQHYPAAIYKANREGGLEAGKKANELANAYDAFIEHSEKNGFLK